MAPFDDLSGELTGCSADQLEFVIPSCLEVFLIAPSVPAKFAATAGLRFACHDRGR